MNQKKKGVMINLDEKTIQTLKDLAEKNSSSMSQEVRRLILNEKERITND